MPIDGRTDVYGGRAVSTVSGQGAIFQFQDNFYELTSDFFRYNYYWRILPQKLPIGVQRAVMMTLPHDHDSRKAKKCKRAQDVCLYPYAQPRFFQAVG